MKNNSYSIKTIFFKKMGYSAIIQFFVFALILVLAKNYIQHNQLNSLSENLIISDSFTMDEIGRYHLLGNKYALDLELYNLENERKLDSIKFIQQSNKVETTGLGSCQSINNGNYKICKTVDGQFAGITAIKQDGKILGYVVAKKQYSSLFSLPVSYGLLLILLTVVGIFLFNFLFLFLSMRKKIENTTGYLLDFISSHQENHEIDISKIDIAEYRKIANKFIDEHTEITNMQKERAYYEVRKNIAEQVAHDIRSPLAAINTAVSDVSSIPENKRIMIRNASKRINDIANNLLLQSKNNFNEPNNPNVGTDIFPELIFVVLDNIVAEKRYEYYKSQVNIQLNVSNCSYNCFSNINLASFKRVLSNLINNSIEASNLNGSVTICLKCNDSTVDISIEDNGCGIPQDVLPKVTEQGFSYNKKNGAGFGLSYAKQYIEKLGGKILIHSEINVGTTVTIRLLRSDYPHWFCKTLNVKPLSVIVVLDDDPSIHDAWNERLSHLSDIKIVHFSKASYLTPNKINDLHADLYLVDYELLADNKNGIDVIEDLNLSKKAVLVTSCFEDITVRSRCKKLGVKIIPKSYVPYIPIVMIPNKLVKDTFVFIDDDEMMRTTWIFAAEEAGVNISTYASPGDFSNEINNYSKDTIIYIDSDLGNNIKGELYAKELYSQGFTEIHLSTGHQPDHFDNMPWIKSIVNKEPPFLLLQENPV